MKLRLFGLAISLLAFVSSVDVQADQVSAPRLVLPASQGNNLSRPLVGRFAVIPAKHFDLKAAETQANASLTIPLWSRGLTSGGTHYTFSMVGRSPFTAETSQTNITAVVVPVALTFTAFSNYVADPAVYDRTCSPAGTALALTKASPLFNPVVGYPGGTYVGTGEYVDLFQRANYWSQTNPSGINPNYQVNLTYAQPIKVSVPVATGTNVANGNCGHIGEMDFTTWNNYIQTTIFPMLASHSPPLAGPTTLTIFLLYNVVLTESGGTLCCVLGYHSAFNDPAYGNAFHAYASVEFDTNQSFTGVSDISAMSHEIAEWMDDPAGNNPTPSWGNIGQVNGCQANLEVGDPLSGTLTQIFMPNNYTYHVQDLTFTSWFYGQKPSTGVNGWYSFLGTFLKPAAPC